MNLPSVKRLQLIDNCTPEIARTIRSMMEGNTIPEEVSEACARWASACYHRPRWKARVMEASNDLLGTYGVEGWADEDGTG